MRRGDISMTVDSGSSIKSYVSRLMFVCFSCLSTFTINPAIVPAKFCPSIVIDVSCI